MSTPISRCGKVFFLVMCSVVLQSVIFAANYGSDTAVSIISPFHVAGTNNFINTFGYAKNGIFFTDATATCTFKSVYPVSGPIDLRGGTLYLDTDLVLSNTGSIISSAVFKGYDHNIEFSEFFNTLSFVGGSSGSVLNLIARITGTSTVNSLDWSYDNAYLAVVNANTTGDDLSIYAFDGTTLTKVAGTNLNNNGLSVRWHPNSYYLAVGDAQPSSELRVYLFNPVGNTVTLSDTRNMGGQISAVAWQKRGRYLVGVRNSGGTSEVNLYSFSTGTGLLTNVATFDLTPNRVVNQDACCWAPIGNNNYFALGTASTTGATPELLVLYFNGTTITTTASASFDQSVSQLDWSPSGTYIALGLQGSTARLRVYQHQLWRGTTTTGALTEATRLSESTTVNAVAWNPVSGDLAVGLSVAEESATEFRVYGFDYSSTPTLSLKIGIDATTNIVDVRYSPNGTYLARGDATTNFVSVYKLLTTGFTLENVHLFLNNDFTLKSPISFVGDCSINGRGNKFIFQNDGSINVRSGSNVNVSLTTLDCGKPTVFALEGRTSKVRLQDTKILLNSDTLWGDGSFEVSNDLVVTGKHTFNYATAFTSTIDAFSQLALTDGAILKMGRLRPYQPLVFTDQTSKLYVDNASLQITNSGWAVTKGEVEVFGNSTFDIASTNTAIGLIFGDGTGRNDPILEINDGANLNIARGAVVLNTGSQDRLQFGSNNAKLSLSNTSSFYVQRPVYLNMGWAETSTGASFYIGPNAYVTTNDLRMTNPSTKEDYYLTGTVRNLNTIILDRNDEIIVANGTLTKDITAMGIDNRISGVGGFAGLLRLQDSRTSLSWDIGTQLSRNNVTLNGGNMIFTQDAGLAGALDFEKTGTITLGENSLNLGTLDSRWTSTLCWDASGGVLNVNSEVRLYGTWTFSGNAILNANGNVFHMTRTGQIKVERGSRLEIQNVRLEEISASRLACLDDAGVLQLTNAMLCLHYHSLFNKGRMIFTGAVGMHSDLSFDQKFTFSYGSSQTSQVDDSSTLKLTTGIRFAIGRYDGTSPVQPLEFYDGSSILNLDNNCTLAITSSGMTITKGTVVVTGQPSMEVASSKYDYALVLGDGTAVNDPLLRVDGGAKLKITSGKVFYNNYYADKGIKFDNDSGSIRVESTNGLVANRSLTLKDGILLFPYGDSIGTVGSSVFTQDNITHIHDSPFSVHRVKAGLQTGVGYLLDNGGYFYSLEGNAGAPMTFRSGSSVLGGSGLVNANITVAHAGVSLTSQMVAGLDNNIALNGGTLILANDLSFLGDARMTGSGVIDLNGHKLAFGTDALSFTDTWVINSASGMDLNAYADLSSTWTFYGTCNLNGHGNVLDLSTGGKLAVGSNSTLYLTDVVLKGLGSNGSNLVLTADNSQIYLSNVYTELDGNISTTIGGIYVEGPSTLGLKNHNWLFDQKASLTVDGVTLWEDSLGSVVNGNVTFGSGALSKYLSLVATGTIKRYTDADAVKSSIQGMDLGIRYNSNALLYLGRVNSNAIANLSMGEGTLGRTTSNAMLYLNRITSAALLYGDRVNSNAIKALDKTARTNSAALVYGNRTNSAALVYSSRTNSSGIVVLDRMVRTVSNAVLYGDRTNSNAVVTLSLTAGSSGRTTSNALLYLNRTTSAALLYGDRVNSNAIKVLDRTVRTASNATVFGTKNNSNALLYGDRVNSNAVVTLSLNTGNLVRTTSNALSYLNRTVSAALLYGDRVNSNAVATLSLSAGNLGRTTSNALLYLNRITSAALLYGDRLNSDAIAFLDNTVRTVSNALLYGDRVNSNAVATLSLSAGNLGRTTSNALLYLNRITSAALSYGDRVNSNAIELLDDTVRTVSNALLYGDRVNSNTLLYLDRVDSSAKLYISRTLSNALAYGLRVNSTALLYGDLVNSNALVLLDSTVRTHSNAFSYGIKNNSDTVLMYSGGAGIITLAEKLALQQGVAELDVETLANSNAIVRLDNQVQTLFGPDPLVITTPSYTMHSDIFLSNDHQMVVQAAPGTCAIDGGGHAIDFANGIAGQINVDPSVELVLYNVVLKNYNDAAVTLASGSGLVFGDGVRVELTTDQLLTRDWTFDGQVTVAGGENQLQVGTASILVQPNTTLRLQSMALSDIKNNRLRCVDDTSIVVLEDVDLNVDHNMSFENGWLEVDQDVHLTGTNTFTFNSDQLLSINANASLYLDGLSFAYAPLTTDNRDLVWLVDRSSSLVLNGCTLNSTTTGMRLTRGTLVVEHTNKLEDPLSTSVSEGFGFGDGFAEDDLAIQIKPGASLTVANGTIVDYANVN